MYDATTATIEQAIAQLQALLKNPPTEGFGDGYTVVHLQGNYHPKAYENTRDDPTDYCNMIDPADPYSTVSAHVEDWEGIAPMIDRMVNPHFVEGMTQAFIVVRTDTKKG